jgi:hypothetical protein
MSVLDGKTELTQWANRIILEASARGFYGKMIFQFENGKLIRCTKEESLKPPIG